MDNKVKCSVIIPVYNTDKYLRKCLDSVIKQTLTDIEIICIDDCSTDNSFKILKEYENKDSRIKVIHFCTNKKQGTARNAGLDIAKGKYITFVDADDYVDSTFLEGMYQKAEKNYCDLVMTAIQNFVDEGDKQAVDLKNKFDIYYKDRGLNAGFSFFDFYYNNMRTGACAKLYKREIIDENKIRFPEGLIQEDEAFYWYYMPFVYNVYYIDEPLYYRRVHSASTIYRLQYKNEGIYNHIQVIRQIYKYLKKKDLYKLYKYKFIDYVETVLNNKKDRKIRRAYLFNIMLFMPEILIIYMREAKLLMQITAGCKNKTVFWGASLFLEEFLNKYKIKNKNIVGIIDRDSQKWGKKICGYEVFSPDQLNKLGVQSIIFTIKNNAYNIYPKVEMFIKDNFPNIHIFPNVLSIQKALKPRNIPQRNIEYIEVSLAEHCNLSCKGCSHFSPLAKEEFMDIKIFEKDIKRISELSRQRIKRLQLMGGEPLLTPNIIDFMRVSRSYLPQTRIAIITNALLLNSRPDEFWQACKRFNIAIEVTKYPIHLDFTMFEKKAEQYDIEYKYYGGTDKVIKTSNHYPVDVLGGQNGKENFKNCAFANLYLFLQNGRLYTCTLPGTIKHFNNYFGCKIPMSSKDGIDIYKAKSDKEILSFLASPIPFCRYCNVKGRTYGEEWGISKKDIKEWT